MLFNEQTAHSDFFTATASYALDNGHGGGSGGTGGGDPSGGDDDDDDTGG